jgi:hypothetical protein
VFGGVAGVAAPEILGWLPVSYLVPRRVQRFFDQPVPLAGWVQPALVATATQRIAAAQHERNQTYPTPARKGLSYHKTDWQGSLGWLRTAADMYTAAVSGWKGEVGVKGYPLPSTRSVRNTVFDFGWVTRAVPGTDIPNIAFISAINPEKGGYPSLARKKHPYLSYEWSPQFGWNWIANVLPLILRSTPATTTQRGQEYYLRARSKAPYMREWSPQDGWRRYAVGATLEASWPAMATQTQQEYPLRGREKSPYLPHWSAQEGWLYAATQLVVQFTYPAFVTEMLQEYPFKSRPGLRYTFFTWLAQQGWMFGPSFVDVQPIIAAIQHKKTSAQQREDLYTLNYPTAAQPHPPMPTEPPEPPGPASITIFIGSAFNSGG